jgi:2-methylcitrate dehydratase PrpD
MQLEKFQQEIDTMTLTHELATLGMARSADHVKAEDLLAAKIQLLDSLGCALAGWQADGCEAVVEQMRYWGGREEASVLFYGDMLPMPQAAFANSVLIHAQDLDDIHIPGTLHIACIVVPAMLAAAQASKATGREALMSLIMGVEIAARIENPGHAHRRGQGFLPSSLAGSFGGVVTAARLLGLTVEQCTHAMGINYAQLSGNRQALYDSTLSKRMQPAFSVRSALWSTALAQRGLTGAHLALEGEAGYYQLYLNMPKVPQPGSLTQPTEIMEIRRVAYKRFASCGANHHVQIAAEQLWAEEHLKPQQIARVDVFGMSAGGIVSRPFVLGPNPQVDAQFSVAWAAAHTLLRGPATLTDYLSENVAADTAVIELAKRVGYIDPPSDLPPKLPLPPDYPGGMVNWQGLVVTTTDGRRLMRCCCPAVTFAPGNLTWEQAVTKFQQCALFSDICNDAQAQDIINQVLSLDQAADLSALLASLSSLTLATTQGK